ncbi:MAG TPA: hypothetical protein VK524_18320 [Polyangiaceae bacterium]|nr:hypothetical protein [Polyangiaceae bacterium]
MPRRSTAAEPAVSSIFPPPPRGLKGRSSELSTLSRSITERAPARVALVGSGGSGKSMLACALGHRLKPHFAGRMHWFRVGAWSFQTLSEMLALAFGTTLAYERCWPELLRVLNRSGERLIVLDNHEDDPAMCRLLQALADTPVTVVITARRCLLAGVLIYPVVAPLVSSGQSAFPRVAGLTRLLRWNPLALDIADAIVASRAASLREISAYLEAKHVSRVHVIAHEDDLPEVALLVAWAWPRLSAASRRMLGVLAHTEGDHMDVNSLTQLARAGTRSREYLQELQRFRLVQEPIRGRFTVHAVVRYAVVQRTKIDANALFEHYVSLLEREPERLLLEQTHLFAAMEHAHRTNDMHAMLRVNQLLKQLGAE